MAENGFSKDQVKELTDKLEAGLKDLFTSDKYLSYLKTMSSFTSYSTRNTLLIHMQMPSATRVAGYAMWQSKFERHVKRGEKGIRIYAPMSSKEKVEKQKLDPETKIPLYTADGKPIIEEVEQSVPRFKLIPVFDVSQTDGKPLPQLAEDLTGDVRQYEAFMKALEAVSPLPIRIEPLSPDTDGLCRYGDCIIVREGMSEVQTVSAAIHEIAHAVCHDKNLQHESNGGEKTAHKDKSTLETEAESISYVVCQRYGIETSANSFGYLASWGSGREMSELKASLDTIRKAAGELIDKIDSRFMAICKERGIDINITPEPEAAATVPDTQPAVNPASQPELKPNQHMETVDGVDFVFTTVKPAAKPPIPEKEYDLGYGHMGNGLTVWNRLEERNGDYVTVAHIDTDRNVTFYDKDMPDSVKTIIETVACTSNITISTTQDAPVFKNPAQTSEQENPPTEPAIPDEPDVSGVLPDPKIGFSERDLFGYTDNTMLPLTINRALELFDNDHSIYLLYSDNTEAVAYDRAEIETHDGIFGIEREEWEVSREFQEMSAAAENDEAASEAVRETELIFGNENTYGIYQLKSGDAARDYRFESYVNLELRGLSVDRANYELVYTAKLDIRDTQTNLHNIYKTFNDDNERPADFTGHSVSVSDVIVLQWRGEVSSHYVDSFGFKELSSFLGNERQTMPTQAAETPPVADNPAAPSVAELESRVKAGQSISILDLANAVKNEQKPPVKQEDSTKKPSILARLDAEKKRTAHSNGIDQPKPAHKRDNNKEVH